jgi:hypothetical protein
VSVADEERQEEEPAEIRLPDPLKRLLGEAAPQPLALEGPTFTELHEAEEWARRNVRGLTYADYSGADLDVVNALNRTVKAISDRYEVNVPAIAPHSWMGWSSRGNAFMSASREGIPFNPEMVCGIFKEEFLAGWALARHSSAANRDWEGIVAHEMAHILQDNARTRAGTILSVETSRTIVRTFVEAHRQTVREANVRAELSDYAWLGGWQETWACAFSAFIRDPKTLAPETAKMVTEVLQALNRS